jgi:DNA-binding GntR family transcriptional regulator
MKDVIQELVVTRFADGWRVVGAHDCEKLYQFRVDAEEAALRLAAQAELRGDQVQVLIQAADGRLQALARGDSRSFH